MSGITTSRPQALLTLDRLRTAVVRNTSAARRSGDDELVAAADAQARAVRNLLARD